MHEHKKGNMHILKHSAKKKGGGGGWRINYEIIITKMSQEHESSRKSENLLIEMDI